MRRLDELLRERSCRALLVFSRSAYDPCLLPFAGAARLARSFVVAPVGREPRLGILTPMERREAALSGLTVLGPEELDVERWSRGGAPLVEVYANVLERALHLCEVAPGQVALAGLYEAGRMHEITRRLAREGWSFVGGEEVVELLRRGKSAADLAELRRLGAGLRAAFGRVAELLAAAEARAGELWLEGERLRVERLQREIAAALGREGLAQPEAGMCAPAEEGAVPHTHGTPERVLRPGESLVVDVYPRLRLFIDCTRTFCAGEPPPALREAHALVREALELARESARPGVRGWTIQQTVCELFRASGHPTPISAPGTERGYVHGLGHGVGFEIHELPSFREHATEEEGRLEVGDVFTLEPGLYDPGAGWGVRLEDTHHLGEDGAEVLTPLPYELDPRAWPTD